MIQMYFLMITLFLTACNPLGRERELLQERSNLQFIEGWQANRSCGYRFALQPSIKLCAKGSGGVSQGDIEKHKGLAANALGEWLKAIQSVEPKATTRVDFSCEQPHLTMNVVPGNGISTGQPGLINIYSQTGYGTQLHEWGHAFACLRDTYEGRSAGKCKPGQPESIMCWGEYGLDKLYPDDIVGIQSTFAKNRSIVLPPSGNPIVNQNNGATDSDAKSRGNQNAIRFPKDIKILLKKVRENNSASSSQATLVFSAPASVQNVWVCAGAFYNSCNEATHGAIEAKFMQSKSNRKIFQGPFVNGQRMDQKLVVEGFDSNKQTRQRRILQIKSR